MTKPVVSLIVPVYNTNPTFLNELFKCFEKLLNNEMFEILIVDDGSTNILTVETEKNLKGTNVKLFSNEHRGVSNSRNLGIKNSNGKYILFVDSDDLINGALLSSIVSNMHLTDDIVFFGVDYKSMEENPFLSNYTKIKINEENDLENIVNRDYMVNCNVDISVRSVWGKLLKKELLLLNNCFFIEDLQYYEDYYFMDCVYEAAKTFSVFNADFYRYRTNYNSTSRKLDYNFFDKFSAFYNLYYEKFNYNHKLILLLSKTILKHVMITRVVIGVKKLNIKYAILSLKEDYIKKSFEIIWNDIKYKKQHFNSVFCNILKFCIFNKFYLITIFIICFSVLLRKIRK